MKTRTKIMLIAAIFLLITTCVCDGGDKQTRCSLQCQGIENEDDWNACMLECLSGHTPEPVPTPGLREG